MDHPFERLLVDTAVAPDPDTVNWSNPRQRAGEVRKVITGIPRKTRVVYTLDRETGSSSGPRRRSPRTSSATSTVPPARSPRTPR
ncbi:MAG: hypothetical protein F4137_00905 [Acidobacteria bacterium]|nr:hypothetical protein [Acidobacteriota bacterium]MYH27429.1 hypothetical protein [Acidobacteriota bacterium]